MFQKLKYIEVIDVYRTTRRDSMSRELFFPLFLR